MPRSFSDQEKQALRLRLQSLARELFSRQGLKKTSLEELTAPLGIAKSSFYLLYESKEALYLDVLAQDGPVVTARVREALDPAAGARAGIARFIEVIFHELETNALTRRMLAHPEELAQLAAHAPPEQVAQNDRNALAVLVPYLQAKQETGELIAGDPVVFARLLAAVTLLSLHRDQIGAAHFELVISTLGQCLARGLTTPPDA